MYEIFGFKIMTKEEKKAEEEAFAKRIFPGGEEERKRVEQRLTEGFPHRDKKELLYLYITVRQKMLENDRSFEEAFSLSAIPALGKFSKEEQEIFRGILEME